jgi:hypothetical protein
MLGILQGVLRADRQRYQGGRTDIDAVLDGVLRVTAMSVRRFHMHTTDVPKCVGFAGPDFLVLVYCLQ